MILVYLEHSNGQVATSSCEAITQGQSTWWSLCSPLQLAKVHLQLLIAAGRNLVLTNLLL